jgi:hypothetical protein
LLAIESLYFIFEQRNCRAKVIDQCYAASVTPPSSCQPSSQDIMPRVTLVDVLGR